MLARAAGRKLRRDVFRAPTTLSDALTLPGLCPARLRAKSHAASVRTRTQDARRQRRRPLTSRPAARSLATTAELQPAPPTVPYNPFHGLWERERPSANLSRLPQWDSSSPLVVRDMLAAAPMVRGLHGVGSDPLELYQNLYACLRVGRVDRASVILARLAKIYTPSAPELIGAHNIYLQTLFELAQQDPKDDSFDTIEQWFNKEAGRLGVVPNAQTFVTLLRSAMSFLEGEDREGTVQRLIGMAHAQSEEALEDVNASPEFTDEEWDMLIRLQPDTYDEPPTIEHVQSLHINSESGRQNLVEHGLAVPHLQAIKPVAQRGMGLDSLRQALTLFDADSVPYPHDLPGTQEEKDRAYAYARQLQVERDSMTAAVARWKHEDEKLREIGANGVTRSKPIQAIMYSWYTALVPLFKKQIEHSKEVLKGPVNDDTGDNAHAYGPWLERCTPEKLAALTVARCINACVRGKTEDAAQLKISAITTALGTDIQDALNTDIEARRTAFLKKQRKETREGLVDKLAKHESSQHQSSPRHRIAGFDPTEIGIATRTKLGALCLELLLQSATLTVTVDDPKTGKTLSHKMVAFHHQVGFQGGKKIGLLVPHHQLMTKLRTEPVHGIQTVKLPMVIEPKPWATFSSGGYYTTPQRVVRVKAGDVAQKSYAQSAIDHGDMDKVLAGLDVLGKVPWQINAPVLDVMAEAWNTGEGIGGLISENVPMERPIEPPADAPYLERAKWGRELQAYENKKTGMHSQRCFLNFQLETARAFANEKQIFFPHSVDFRGRAYPIPPILNHIGADISRGLLKFARGKALGTVGLQWLKIHLANLYGFDKASLREREQFAMDNMNEIYDSANNPLGGQRWWTKAEDPWQCLACCMELKNAFELPDPTTFVSQFPVHQDGTCNGLQHYAALGGDHAGARQVNLEPSDRPQDIYTGVAEIVKEMVAKDAEMGRPMAVFINGHITRKVVKRTVMTNVYGVTFMGAKAQVLGELNDIFPHFKETEKVRSLSSVALYVAFKIFDALGKIFNGAQEIQYWLGECGDRITTSITSDQITQIQKRYEGTDIAPYDDRFKPPTKITNLVKKKWIKSMEAFKTSIIWTTPLKMPIVQPYRKEGIQIIKTKVQDINITKRSALNEVDKRKQLQAFPPNFIHSLDATHMILSALKCSEKGLDFAAVHDSFWTHASDIPNLNVIIRDAFVRMHSEDVVGRLAAEFSTRYAGAMYRANLVYSASVSQKINKWRYHHRKASRKNGETIRAASATFEEVALEARRQELLKSEDPEQRRLGEAMETPTSIWLAHQDPKSMASFRLNLLGETKSKQSSDRQHEVRDKVLGGEADTIMNKPTQFTLDLIDSASDDPLADPATLDSNSDADAELAFDTSKRSINYHSIVQVWLPLTFPPVPKKGGWDVSRLRESKYFFS